MKPALRIYFRMHVSGAEHVPAEGAAIVAPNHKSFWDSFFIAVCTRRHLRFMAKTELIEARYGRLLVRLGAFPVRRGESDEDALETARTILAPGRAAGPLPGGHAHPRPGRARPPQARRRPPGARGAARRSCPAAITGTEQLFLGPFPKPRRVQVAFAEPIEVGELAVDAGGRRPSWWRSSSGPRSRASSGACGRARR